MLLLCRKMQTILFFILIYKLFICVEADEHIQVIRVKTPNLIYMTLQNYVLINEVYDEVLPGQRLRIVFVDYYLSKVVCWTHSFGYNIGDFGPGRRFHSGQDFIINIKKVANYMSDIWGCRVYENHDTWKHIYFEIIVKGAKPGQMILVNNSILRIRKEYDGYYTAEYYYLESEEADLVCVSPKNNNCSVVIYKAKDVEFLRSDFAYRYNLKDADIREMVCTCYDSTNYNNKTTLVTNFLLQDNNEDKLKLTINGRTVRGLRKIANNSTYVEINYAYLNRDILKVVCESENHRNISFFSDKERAVTAKWTTNHSLQLNVIPSNVLLLSFSPQHNSTTSSLDEKIMITFKQINIYERYNSSSTPPRSNVTLTTGTPRTSIFTTTSTLPLPSVTPGDQKSEILWIPLIVSIIVIIVLVCVITIIYKIKKRKRLAQRKREADAAITPGADQGQSDLGSRQIQSNPE